MKRFWNTKWIPKRIRRNHHLAIPVTFVTIFAIVGGIIFLFASHAATPPPPQSLEARVKADGLELVNAKGPNTNATAIAKRRKADIVKLIQTDPDKANLIALPNETSPKLGKDTKDDVEQTVTLSGTLDEEHGNQAVYDDQKNYIGLKDIEGKQFIQTGNDKVYVYASKGTLEKHLGNLVEVKGVRVGDQMAVSHIKTIPIPLITKDSVAQEPGPVLAATTTATTLAASFDQPSYDGATIAGVYPLNAESSNSGLFGGVSKLEWDIDGVPVYVQDYNHDLGIRVDTSTFSQGQHTITYKAYNFRGDLATASRVVIFGSSTLQRVALVVFQLQNSPPPPNGSNDNYFQFTLPNLTDYFFGSTRSVAGYYKEQSYGKHILTGKNNPAGDVYGMYTIPYAWTGNTLIDCPNYGTYMAAGTQAAINSGLDRSQYDQIFIMGRFECSTSLAGSQSIPDGYRIEGLMGQAVHELGHLQGASVDRFGQGLYHAHSWQCVDANNKPVQISSNCTQSEYGDVYDVMGGGKLQHMNVFEKGQIGYFPTNSAQQATTVKTAGTYTLSPSTLPTSGVKSIRIPRTVDSTGTPIDYYYLEFRQPTPYDTANETAVNPAHPGTLYSEKDFDGIQIRVAPEYYGSSDQVSDPSSKILDTTPGSIVDTLSPYRDLSDARLPVGQSFQDPTTGINIKTTTVSTSGATFQLSYGTPQCERHAPTISPLDSTWVNPGQTVNTGVTITNNDSPACGPSNFNLSSTLASGLTQTPSSASVSIGPAGATQTVTFTVTSSSSVAAGYYPFTENVTNTTSGQSASVTGSYNVTTLPFGPVNVGISSPTAGATYCCTVQVNVGYNSSYIEFKLDGVVLTASNGFTADQYGQHILDTTKFANGSHTLSVTASSDISGRNTATATQTFIINNAGNADTTPPTVSLTSPISGSTVTGPIDLTATASDSSGIARVDFSIDGAVVNSGSTSPYSFTWDSSLVSNGTHFITATAYDKAGNLNTSQVSVTTKNGDIDTPSAPTNLSATSTSSSQINLSWTASTDNVGVTGYYIVRDGVTLPALSGTTTTFSDTGLLPGSTHSYQVTAFDAAGNNSNPSTPATATTQVVTAPDTAPPSPPTGLASNVLSATQVNLSWTASTDNVGVARYDIYRSDNTRAPKASVSGTTTSFGDTTTLGGKTYSYYIYAYDSAGNKSVTSSKISVTTPSVSTTLGSMTGRVVDGNGKALTSGSVYYYVGTSKKSYNLNSNGNYTISSILPNTYTFTYICTGCNTEITSLQILAGQNISHDQVLHKLGGISGLVTDVATNKAISNVVITYQLSGVTKTLKTSNHTPINYALTGLPAGDYTLSFSLTGYQTQTKTITVNLDQTLTQDITLSK